MSTTRTLALAFALLAPPLAAQTAPRAAQPGWIGFFAGFEQSPSSARPVAIVLAVAEGSPAARVGLAEGDTLLAVDGAPLTPEALKTLAAGLRAGEQVELTLRRAGARLVLAVRAEPRPAAQAPDPVEIRVGSARRLLGGDAAERTPSSAPFNRRVIVRASDMPAPPGLPETESPTPFSVHVFGDERTDSLVVTLRDIGRRLQEVERGLVAARSAESARVRELAARATGGRIDATDSQLAQLRDQRRALANEQELLRATLEQVVAVRAEAPLIAFGEPSEWTLEVAPPAESAAPAGPAAGLAPVGFTRVVRPMTPYIAGRDRVAGARVTPLNPGLSEYFGTARGVLVVEVATGTPAEEAGLRPGDVLLRVGGAEVNDLEALRRAVGAAPGSQPIALVVLRKGVRLPLSLPR